MRIGPRCNISCANISTRDGRTLSWFSELRYLGILIVKSRNFKCSLANAKCNFYRAVNGIFSRILNFASKEVILELITRKCMPILLYGLESCQLSNGDLHSLDSTYNRMCMKLFKSSNIELITECQGYFRCLLPSLNVKERCQKFISKYETSVNTFCKYCNAL